MDGRSLTVLLSAAGMADETGRPLAEGRAPDAQRAGVAFELRTCPYPGSRHHHAKPMNVSALRQLTEHWKVTLRAMAHVRSAVRSDDQPLAFGELLRLTRALWLLPGFLVHRASDPLPAERLPVAACTAYKIAVGLLSLVEKLAMGAVVQRQLDLARVLTADELLAAAEATSALVGAKEVCAGPAAMIREALDATLTGRADGAPERVLDDVLPDPAALLRFADVASVHSIARVLFQLEHVDAMRELSALAGDDPELARSLAQIGGTDDWAANRMRAIATLPPPVRAAITADLVTFAHAGDAASAEILERELKLPPAVLDASPAHTPRATALARYLDREQRVIRAFRGIEDRMNEVIGRSPREPGFAADEVTQLFGPTPRDVLAQLSP